MEQITMRRHNYLRVLILNWGLKFLVAVGILMYLQACDFNFPEENQEIVYNTDKYFHFEGGTHNGVIQFGLGVPEGEKFQLVVYPKWVEPTNFEGQMQGGFASIAFRFVNVDEYLFEGRAEGYIFVRMGSAGIFRITLTYGNDKIIQPPVEGQEPMYIYPAVIDFGTESSASFVMENKGSVDKSWYVTDIPSWMELSASSGILQGGETKTVNCLVNREGLSPGKYEQIINIESDKPQISHGILLQMTVEETGNPVNTAAIKWINGEVKGAYYCKQSHRLFMLTKSPNQLLVYVAGGDTIFSHPLDRIPNCMRLTADGKKLAIAYNQAIVDLWDADSLKRITQYETDCVPYDIVFGENGWLYLAPETDQHVHLYSLNLSTGVTYRTQYEVTYEKTRMVKMPGKPLLYITRPGLSPSGLLIANIENGAVNDTLPSWHEDLGGRLWLTKDGSKIIGGNKSLYRTPEYTTTNTHNLDLPKLGTFDIPRNYIFSLDYNETVNHYFAVGSDYLWEPENASTIYEIDEVSYAAVKSVKVSTYPGFVQNKHNPAMDVHYAFSNKEGTKLFALKNVERSLDENHWALEILNLPLP